MNFRDFFVPYIKDLEEFLVRYFRKLTLDTTKINPMIADRWEKLEVFMQGGKRLRGALVKLGYTTESGTKFTKTLPIAAAIEIVHGAILVHDDIIDQDEFRHRKPTIHQTYKRFHEKKYKKKDPLHYGESMGIVIADAGLYNCINIIGESSFCETDRLRMINQLARTMTNTAYGELLDVDYEYHENISDSAVYQIHTLKTAYYTFINPLKIGAIASGAKDTDLAKYEKYGLPIGIAFQLVDDILGVFGDEKKTGKPADSDIREGKNTLLYTQAVKRATAGQKARLKAVYGKQNITQKSITEKEIDVVRQIFRDTGSLEYSRREARKLADEAITAIPQITKDKSLQKVYKTLADYIVERDN